MRERVLILCTANSARSQMAEGLLRHIAGERYEVHSAGARPSFVRPEAIAALAEKGIDISGHRSKSVDEFAGQAFDHVVTVCDNARDACPVFPGAGRRIHHAFEDPAAATADSLTAFRRVRDQLAAWLRRFPPPVLRAADPLDRAAVDAMLAAAHLVAIDDEAAFGSPAWVVAERNGAIVGAAGVEPRGGDGLLRSVVVAESERGGGLGADLARDRIEWARAAGLGALYLLTTTAAGYWPRFGFTPIARAGAPAAIQRSAEWASACPASAAAYRLDLRT